MQQTLHSLIDAAAEIDIDHQNDQQCVSKVADNTIITDAVPPQARQASGEGLAPTPGAVEGRDCSKRGAYASGGVGVSFPKPLRRVW